MIVKIDHIAHASQSLDKARGALEAIGYEVRFMERNLKDLSNKRGFMRHFNGQLEMALMTRQGSIGIELLNHGHVVEGESYFLPVFEGLKRNAERSGEAFSFDGDSFWKVKSDFIGGRIFVTEDEEEKELRCNKLVLEVDDLEKSVDFWGYLGFKAVSFGADIARMEFKAPVVVGRTYQLYVREVKRRPANFCLDSQGFNCIAFISSDANREWSRFEALGVERSDVNAFRVNGKDLRIFWLRGPCGEIVEVIGLAR
jgi:hypothetical protein